jgi:hypothetical protein
MLILSLIMACGGESNVAETTANTIGIEEEVDVSSDSLKVNSKDATKVSNKKDSKVTTTTSIESSEEVPMDEHTTEESH